MKKWLILSAAVLAFSAAPAMAEEGGAGKDWHGKMWEQADADGDGAVSKAEFLARSEERFALIDADGDGNISKEEMQSHHEAMRGKMKQHRHMHREGKAEEAAPADDSATDVQ